MPEPERSRARPISMTRMPARPPSVPGHLPGHLRGRRPAAWAGALVATALLAVGCGSAERSADTTAGATPSADGTSETVSTVGSCPVDSPAVTSARAVTQADLNGDGESEQVKLTRPDGDCPNLLFAALEDGHVSAQLETGPPVAEAYGVEVPGREGDLVVTRQNHPRGGFQTRIYAVTGETMSELKVDGQLLVPFVALDVEERPLSVDCIEGGVVLTEAVAHEPSGAKYAWDIKRTSYTLEGGEVTAGPSEEIADNVPPKDLATKYPELTKYVMFPSCRTAG